MRWLTRSGKQNQEPPTDGSGEPAPASRSPLPPPSVRERPRARMNQKGRQAEAAGTAPPASAPAKLVELIVGLGNPGSEYAGNRHNVGFWTVNRLGRRIGIEVRKHSGMVSTGEGLYNGRRLILAKPRTFMNNSGNAVRALVRRYRLEPSQVVVVYDDLDLPVGKVRIRARGSHGGNNGLRSVLGQLGSQDVPRIRIGIGRPVVNGTPSYDPEDVADWVLSDPSPAHREKLDAAVAKVVDALVCVLDEGVEAAMNKYNRD
jgi:PTH1 family peptidyl-tRNA hydrolase